MTELYLPPEVCGCLSVAQKHLDAGRALQSPRWRERKAKHASKVQKLVSRAARLLARRGVSL